MRKCLKCEGLMIHLMKGRLQFHKYSSVPEELYYCPPCRQFYYPSGELKEVEI